MSEEIKKSETKPKRKMTEQQLANLAKGREKKKENAEKRKQMLKKVENMPEPELQEFQYEETNTPKTQHSSTRAPRKPKAKPQPVVQPVEYEEELEEEEYEEIPEPLLKPKLSRSKQKVQTEEPVKKSRKSKSIEDIRLENEIKLEKLRFQKEMEKLKSSNHEQTMPTKQNNFAPTQSTPYFRFY